MSGSRTDAHRLATAPGAATAEALDRRSRTAPVSPPDAWALIAKHCAPLAVEVVPIEGAATRVLAEAVLAPVDLPRETNSAMDGFAVRTADGAQSAAAVIGESRAGEPFKGSLSPGTVVRIATGASVPVGADAVVRVEDVTVDGDHVALPAASVGDNIRYAGEDLATGTPIVGAGTRLAPHHLIALAAAGIAELPCHRRPVVSVVVTGDEIVPPGAPVGPGQVTDVHGIALPALVRAAGGEVGEVVHAPDQRTELTALLERLEPCDIVLVTGGLSVGEHDHTRPALEELGVELVVQRLLLRPGQPTAVGIRTAPRQLWFGLPGNPVSAFAVSALLLVPAIRALAGDAPSPFATRRAPLAEAVRPDATRWLALRATARGDAIDVLQGQGSHMVAALARASALVLLEPGDTELPAGALVDVLDLDRLLATGASA